MKKLLFLLLISLPTLAQKPIPQSGVIGLTSAFTLVNSRLAGHDSQLLTLLPTSLFNSYTATVTSALGGKVDASVFTSYTAGVATSLASLSTATTTNATNLTNYIASNNTALGGKVNNTRTLTINGTTQDLGNDRTWTIPAGPTGPAGPAGPAGPTGATGTQGPAGTPGSGGSQWTGSSSLYFNGSVGLGMNAAPFGRFHVITGSGYSYNDGTILEAPSGDRVFNYPVQDQWWQWDTYRGSDGRRLPMSFNPSGGNVGIGVGNNTPASTLDVGGTGIKIRSGSLQFPDGTSQTTAATSGGGGGGGFPTQLGTLVSGTTGAALQAAINAASAGATLVLANDIDVSGGTVEINKKITLTTYNGSGLNGGTGNVMLLKIYNCDGVKLLNLKFTTSYAGGGFQYGMITINEQGPVTNLTINNCEFTAPTGAVGSTYNAITGNAYSSGNSVVHSNWTITNNYAHDLNRMFIELNNNGTDGAVRYTNLNISHNRILHTGLVDPYDGMGISLSGRIDQVKVNDNTIDDYKGYGIEFVQTSGFEAIGNNLTTTKTFVRNNGTEGSNGYNLTDGGATDGGTPGRGSRKGNISGGYVNVPGKGIVAYFVSDISINGGYYYSGAYLNIQNSSRITLAGLQVESLFQSCLKLDGSSYCVVSGGRYSTENAVGGKYEQIGMFGSATGNTVTGVGLYGTSDNGSNILGPAGNKWANVFFGGAYLNN